MNIYELHEEVEELVEKILGECTLTHAPDLGLDARCGKLWVGDEFIASGSAEDDRVLQYYGGFEYVDQDDRLKIGRLTLYSKESGRVAECFDYLNDKGE